MASAESNFDRLDPAGRVVAGAARAPRAVVYVTLACAVALSWVTLLLVAGRQAQQPGAMTAGQEFLKTLPILPLPDIIERLLGLCLAPAPSAVTTLAAFPVLVIMWMLMSVAMMLPSAAPMVRTYCEIADTAAAKGEAVVHPLVLVGGYLAVWLAGSSAFAAISVFVQSVASAFSSREVAFLAASLALAIAGLYQFSGLKEACLKKCRSPFARLFSRWTTRPSGVFRLGVEEGLWCLGCCWALMLVMFAVGVMNVFWMALIGVFAIVEKQMAGPMASRIAGAILLVWSATLLVLSL